MKRNAICTSTLTILVSISLAGCGQQSQLAGGQKALPIATATNQQTTPEVSEQQQSPASDHLAEALRFAPEGTTQVSFIDWGLIKEHEGATALNSNSSVEKRMKFFLTIDQPRVPQGVWSLGGFDKFSNAWSWDATDLVWEATITRGDEPPIYVIKFRDDFDFAPVLAHFSKRGFQESQYDDATIYSRIIDGSASDHPDAALFNTAMLRNQNIYVLSPEASNVHVALDAYSKQSSGSIISKQVGPITDRLGAEVAVLIQIGAGACPFPGPSLRIDSQVANDVLTQKVSQTHSYSALAVAYRYEGKSAPGMIVFHYADAASAQIDLHVRSDEVAKGHLLYLVRNAPISKYMTLNNALVEGNDIVMRVQPIRGNFLLDSALVHDVTYAACP